VIWFVVTLVLVLGLSTMCWATVGVGRLVAHRVRWASVGTWDGTRWTPSDVAVLIAARNEELVLPATLRAARAIVPASQIFVVSDASTDCTATIARSHGARVMELVHNRGKAGAIVAGLKHFDLAGRFAIVMLLDADTHPSPDYLESGLQLFNHRKVVAVAGRAATLFDSRTSTRVGRLLLAYRERTYVAVQTLHKFGQGARHANAVTIVPGFASMYRTHVLSSVDIAAPGLAIEDYNMTFEIHAKNLGRVAFDPSAARAYTQDPDSIDEYVRQVRRWSLGFWQTTMRHRLHLRVFWVAVVVFAFEVFMSSVLLVLVVPVVLVVLLAGGITALGIDPGGVFGDTAGLLPVGAVVLGILVPDLVLTLYTAIVARDARYLTYAPVFPVLRVLDAVVCLGALRRAVAGGSNGIWRSPARR